jgi:hypothetical protein
MIELTRNEIAHLAAALLPQPTCDQGYRARWSDWRRCHQYTARICHHRRQAAHDPDHHRRRQPARLREHQRAHHPPAPSCRW